MQLNKTGRFLETKLKPWDYKNNNLLHELFCVHNHKQPTKTLAFMVGFIR